MTCNSHVHVHSVFLWQLVCRKLPYFKSYWTWRYDPRQPLVHCSEPIHATYSALGFKMIVVYWLQMGQLTVIAKANQHQCERNIPGFLRHLCYVLLEVVCLWPWGGNNSSERNLISTRTSYRVWLWFRVDGPKPVCRRQYSILTLPLDLQYYTTIIILTVYAVCVDHTFASLSVIPRIQLAHKQLLQATTAVRMTEKWMILSLVMGRSEID